MFINIIYLNYHNILLIFIFFNFYSTLNSQTITDIDGNVYDTINIGHQTWLKQNLKVTRYRNGDSIPNITDTRMWGKQKIGAYCIYDNKTEEEIIYPKLYNWYVVSDSRGICPDGWHVPDGLEWKKLINYLGGNISAGGRLKSVEGWEGPNEEATDSSGFSALPCGHRFNDGSYVTQGYNCNYWTSSKHSARSAYSIYLNTYVGFVENSSFENEIGLSIRCIKDEEEIIKTSD